MISIKYRHWTIHLLILIPLFVSFACKFPQPGGGTPEPETSTSEMPANEQIDVQGNVAFGPGVFNHPEPAMGLAELSSYKATLTLSFDGTNAGLP
jgi:hypothetical protein